MIWVAKESAVSWLPGFQFEWIPTGITDKIRFVRRGQHQGLEIDGVVGAIPLRNGDTLQITPKIGQVNFLRMLFVCESIMNELKRDLEGFVEYQEDQAIGSHQLLARSFASELNRIHSMSLRFNREPRVYHSSMARGRIKLVPTILNIRMRRERPVVSVSMTRDYSTAENRVLGAAAVEARRFLHRPEWIIDWWMRKYSDRNRLLADLAEVNRKIKRGFYFGSRGYYIKALVLARIILGQAGVGLGTLNEIYGDAALVNSASLFEEYVRKVMARGYQAEGLVVRKGSASPECLYVDGSYQLNPDICVLNGVKLLLIGDAKYKNPDAGNHYQVQAYVRLYGLKRGFILYPIFDRKEAVEVRTARDGLKIFEIGLPLADLDATEKLLARLHEVVPFLQ